MSNVCTWSTHYFWVDEMSVDIQRYQRKPSESAPGSIACLGKTPAGSAPTRIAPTLVELNSFRIISKFPSQYEEHGCLCGGVIKKGCTHNLNVHRNAWGSTTTAITTLLQVWFSEVFHKNVMGVKRVAAWVQRRGSRLRWGEVFTQSWIIGVLLFFKLSSRTQDYIPDRILFV